MNKEEKEQAKQKEREQREKEREEHRRSRHHVSWVVRYIYPILYLIILFTIITGAISLVINNPGSFLAYMGSYPALILFALIPCILLHLHLLYTAFHETHYVGAANAQPTEKIVYVEVPVAGEQQQKKNPFERKATTQPKRDLTLKEMVALVDDIREHPQMSARKIMSVARKLESHKFKPQFKDDAKAIAVIKGELNYCYDRLGDVEYDVTKAHPSK